MPILLILPTRWRVLLLRSDPRCGNTFPQHLKGEVLAELSEGVFRDLSADIDKDQLIDSIKLLHVDDIADLVPDLPQETLEDVINRDWPRHT